MKVIFLDIDGVLNHHKTEERFDGFLGIDASKIPFLKTLVGLTNAVVVLSSTWRLKERSFVHVIERLAEFDIEIFDRTPNLGRNALREQEVEYWLADHEDVTHYVILDDVNEFFGMQEHYVQTYMYDGGLQQVHVDEAVRILSCTDLDVGFDLV